VLELVGREGYHKIAKLLADLMRACTTMEVYIAPDSLLKLIDVYAQGVGQWLKVAGLEKAALVETALEHHCWAESNLAVEFGAYVGYTSVRLARHLTNRRSIMSSPRTVSLEVDHVHQTVSRFLLDITQLTPWGEVWNGQVKDLLPRVADELGAHSVAFVFMDHRGTRFQEDLSQLVSSGTQGADTDVVADNVLNPGSPIFAWSTVGAEHIVAWSVTEYMSVDREDWMVVVDGFV